MITTSPFVKTLHDKPVAVFGLGLSGLATARALLAGKARVVAWDDDEETRLRAERENIPVFDFIFGGMDGYGALVLAPGIPLNYPEPHKVVIQARGHNVHFAGMCSRADALLWIASGDELWMSSRTEGASTVVREAEALGTAVRWV